MDEKQVNSEWRGRLGEGTVPVPGLPQPSHSTYTTHGHQDTDAELKGLLEQKRKLYSSPIPLTFIFGETETQRGKGPGQYHRVDGEQNGWRMRSLIP